jgi:hypothetical protein
MGKRDISGILITTEPGGVIEGRLVAPGLARKLDMTSLRVFPVAADRDAAARAVLASGPVQADGTFVLRNVFGRSLIYVGAPSDDAALKGVYYHNDDVTRTGLAIGAGAHVHGVTIVIGDPAAISGTVRSSLGEPARNKIVIVFAEDSSKWRDPLNRYVRLVRTEDDGAYSVSDIPAGEYRAVAVEHVALGVSVDPTVLAQLRASGNHVGVGNQGKRILNLTLPAHPVAGESR